jgi:hypothetical protein
MVVVRPNCLWIKGQGPINCPLLIRFLIVRRSWDVDRWDIHRVWYVNFHHRMVFG